MKRLISIILITLLALSLCACDNKTTSKNNEIISNGHTTELDKYVGTWVTNDNRADIYSIRFLSNGKFMYDVGGGTDQLVTDGSVALHTGEWQLDGERLLAFVTSRASSHDGEVFIFRIKGNSISWGENDYFKVEE